MSEAAATPPPAASPAGLPPLCPITGLTGSRLIQRVSCKLLSGLWRVSFNVRTGYLFGEVTRFGLWESPCGLAFFDPMVAGDTEFYETLYARVKIHEAAARPGVNRPEFSRAASFVAPGDRVLDVGGGKGAFARLVPHAIYVGLDLHAKTSPGGIDLRAETIGRHASRNAGTYDVVCAFQVIEHVIDPVAFVTDMLACLRPGGRLLIGVPLWPSPMTDIPNFAFNAPPHHLSWWTDGALRALCSRLRVDVESIETLPVGSYDSILYWMGRYAPKLTGQRFFRADWRWYCALAWAWSAGRIADALRKPPATAARLVLLLSGQKPA